MGLFDFHAALAPGAEKLHVWGDPSVCVRLCAGRAHGVDGLIVDVFGSLVVASLYDPNQGQDAARLLSTCQTLLPGRDVLVKARVDSDQGQGFRVHASPGFNALSVTTAAESGLTFEIHRDVQHDFGLYLDAAKARLRVKETARGKNVLNLFSYTCGFGVAAAAGGAASVTNVDPNKDYLAWGKRNAALNGVEMRVLPDTAQVFLEKHLRRMERGTAKPFEIIILDPPAFGVGRGNDRLLRLLWPTLFSSLSATRPEHVLLMCNDKYFRTRKDFIAFVDEELGGAYDFERLGTVLTEADLRSGRPGTVWTPQEEDPFYVEPIVLFGSLRA